MLGSQEISSPKQSEYQDECLSQASIQFPTTGLARQPVLSFCHSDLPEILEEYRTPTTLLIGDAHNFPVLSRMGPAVLIDEAEHHHLARTCRRDDYVEVIAVGGCTALDYGRACTKPGARLIAVPSILSTSCISVDRSVIYRNGAPESRLTAAPDKVIISFPLLMAGDPNVVAKWSHSGFGDLFACLSAAIDYVSKQAQPDFLSLASLVPHALEALDWVIATFKRFDEATLARLASYLHLASLDVLQRGDTVLSAAGEHQLYYAMLKDCRYTRDNPTHGELVSVGTLLSAMALRDLFGVSEPYKKLRAAFSVLELPLTYHELRQIGIQKRHILEGLRSLAGTSSFLARSTRPDLESLLNQCYQ